MARVTIAELQKELALKEALLQETQYQKKEIMEHRDLLLKQLDKGAKEYVLIEVAERNFCVGKLVIGTSDKYSFVCTCRNRGQAERLLEILNKQI